MRSLISLILLFALRLTATGQIGVHILEYTDVTAYAKDKAKDVHSFQSPAHAVIETDYLELDVPDSGTHLHFDYETTWRDLGNGSYSIGVVDLTGWEWIATFTPETGTLVLTDGSKWTYRYTTEEVSASLNADR